MKFITTFKNFEGIKLQIYYIQFSINIVHHMCMASIKSHVLNSKLLSNKQKEYVKKHPETIIVVFYIMWLISTLIVRGVYYIDVDFNGFLKSLLENNEFNAEFYIGNSQCELDEYLLKTDPSRISGTGLPGGGSTPPGGGSTPPGGDTDYSYIISNKKDKNLRKFERYSYPIGDIFNKNERLGNENNFKFPLNQRISPPKPFYQEFDPGSKEWNIPELVHNKKHTVLTTVEGILPENIEFNGTARAYYECNLFYVYFHATPNSNAFCVVLHPHGHNEVLDTSEQIFKHIANQQKKVLEGSITKINPLYNTSYGYEVCLRHYEYDTDDVLMRPIKTPTKKIFVRSLINK